MKKSLLKLSHLISLALYLCAKVNLILYSISYFKIKFLSELNFGQILGILFLFKILTTDPIDAYLKSLTEEKDEKYIIFKIESNVIVSFLFMILIFILKFLI